MSLLVPARSPLGSPTNEKKANSLLPLAGAQFRSWNEAPLKTPPKHMPPCRAHLLSTFTHTLRCGLYEIRRFAARDLLLKVESGNSTLLLNSPLIPCFCTLTSRKPAIHAAFQALTKKFPVKF